MNPVLAVGLACLLAGFACGLLLNAGLGKAARRARGGRDA